MLYNTPVNYNVECGYDQIPPSTPEIVYYVWNALLSDYTTNGTTGEAQGLSSQGLTLAQFLALK